MLELSVYRLAFKTITKLWLGLHYRRVTLLYVQAWCCLLLANRTHWQDKWKSLLTKCV